MMKFLSWLFSVIFAFNLGAAAKQEPREGASELQKKVQEHLDVIVDEAAAMVDDVVEEVRKDERVQSAEEFVGDVKEIVNNTVEDIHEHFDKPAEETTDGAAEETAEPAKEAEPEPAAAPETPGE